MPLIGPLHVSTTEFANMKTSTVANKVVILSIVASMIANVFCVRAAEEDSNADAPAPVYSVAKYDPKRSPEEDLKMTIEQAEKGKKRILLVVGGEWCSWCHLMDDYFKKNSKVATALADGFVIMKVNMSQDNRNETFLSKYKKKSIAYPHIFVLETNGKLIHSQGTGELEEGRGYNEKLVMEFLAEWTPGS